MKKQDYTATIVAATNPAQAFKCINEVSKWWTENMDGSTDKLNDVFTVHFAETFVTFKVIDFMKDKRVSWLVTDCYLHWLKDKKEWQGTTLSFDISVQNDSTQIRFTHIGLVPVAECYNDCVKGWDQYFKESLFRLISEGKGRPERKKLETV